MKLSFISFVLACCFITSAAALCPEGDVDGDCRVNYSDLMILAHQWLSDPNNLNDLNDPNTTDDPNDVDDPNGIDDPNGVSIPNASSDLNDDGRIDVKDLAILTGQWGQIGCPIVVNELLAHSHDAAPDWIELHNVSSVPIDLTGWTLSDRADDLAKYRIAEGTTIAPHGYVLFYEDTQFGNPFDPGTISPFRMSENGETLYLHSGACELFPDCLIETTFGASETDVTFGRYGTSMKTHSFVLMSEPTPGQANAHPLVGPLVINEIMYRPAGDGDAEYVELLNISSGPVTLFDFESLEPWRFTDDTGIDFRFATDYPVTVEAGQHLLLARDASLVRRSFHIPMEIPIFEWDSGRLANSGETIRLLKPGDVDEMGTRYWIEVDRLRYSDGAHGENFENGSDPWPGAADGLGASLNRLSPTRYGNDPNNWQAAIPTPGSAND